MYSFPPPLPTIAAPGQPAPEGARVRTHGLSRQPRSSFLAAGAAAAPRAGLAPSGDPSLLERGDPERPWSLLSAAGGRVATFVNCKQTHVVLQQSRPCLVLVAFPPALPPPPSRGCFLPLFTLSLSGRPHQREPGGPGARGPRAGDYVATPRLRAWGGAESRVVCVLAGRGSAAGRGRACVGVQVWAGPEGQTRSAQSRCGPEHVGGCWLARSPPAPGRCLLARPGRDSAALLE